MAPPWCFQWRHTRFKSPHPQLLNYQKKKIWIHSEHQVCQLTNGSVTYILGNLSTCVYDGYNI